MLYNMVSNKHSRFSKEIALSLFNYVEPSKKGDDPDMMQQGGGKSEMAIKRLF